MANLDRETDFFNHTLKEKMRNKALGQIYTILVLISFL